MRIVISGGLGFIGSNFISKALKKNYKIYNIDGKVMQVISIYSKYLIKIKILHIKN